MKLKRLKVVIGCFALSLVIESVAGHAADVAYGASAGLQESQIAEGLQVTTQEDHEESSEKEESGDEETEKKDEEAEKEDTNKEDEGTEKEDTKEDTNKEDEGTENEDTEKKDEDTENEDADKKNEVKLDKPVLYAFSKPGHKIKLKWGKSKNAAEYMLYRSIEKNSGFHRIYKTKTNTRYYLDEGRIDGKTYYYKLTAFSKGRTKRADSKIVKGCSLKKAELTQISNLSGSQKLILHWKSVKGAAGYQIQRRNQAGQYKDVASVKGKKLSYTDRNRSGGKIYSYRVCAEDANGGHGNYSAASSQMAIDKNKKMIALTYDDGPSDYTPVVLNALEKYGAHATFFVVGNRVNNYGSSIRREVALGCEIGNHTYGHNSLGSLGASQVQSVLAATNRTVKKQAGVDIHIMRPPGGGYNSITCAAAGMPLILWSVDTLDWKTRNTAATIQCVQQNARDGAVVLMHDLHQPTANAADAIISYLKSAGYQMLTVSEMAAYRGGLAAGVVYTQFGK